jgi:hypothetical protein
MEFGEEGEEELKTVIDVLRISARNYKKRIIRICVGFIIALLAFTVLDTINGWTKVGMWCYDFLFPPAIEIVTVPEFAQIHLDGNPIAGRTPLSIDKISPGVHKLELSLEGYKPIIKSLFVPREGSIKVQGEKDTKNRSYLFRFSTEIEINSEPQGANVFINGIRFNQKTPCQISWEIGNPLSIALDKSGFEKLADYSLNTIEGYDEVEDRRLWDLKVFIDNYKKYAITGIFRKRIVIETIPSGVEIYDASTSQLIGSSGANGGVFLTSGAHELLCKKQNFITRRLTLNIDETSNEKIRVVLSRKVKFSSIDAFKQTRGDIGATLVSLKSNNREFLKTSKRTPFSLNLPAYGFKALFAKSGFQRTEVRIEPDTRSLQVKMSPSKAPIQIQILDALTNEPVSGVQLYYTSAGNSESTESLLAQTNYQGVATGQVKEGNHVIRITKAGYVELKRPVITRHGDTNNFIFKIFPSN